MNNQIKKIINIKQKFKNVYFMNKLKKQNI